MALASPRYVQTFNNLNFESNRRNSSSSHTMVVLNDFSLLSGRHISHPLPNWNPISASLRLLISGPRNYKRRWPITTPVLVLFSKIFSGARGSLVHNYSSMPKYISIRLSISNISVMTVSGHVSFVGPRLALARESLMRLQLQCVLFVTLTKPTT